MPRREQALDRRLALAERALERVAALGESRRLGAQPPCLDAQRREGPIGVGNGALGVAQRIARLAPRGFLVLQLLGKGFDAGAQGLQLFILRCGLCRERREAQGENKSADQTLALPCAETAAMRRATSWASPR
jgi:hypothetical protein